MLDLACNLKVHSFLNEIAEHYPNDIRHTEYEAIFKVVEAIDPQLFPSFTTIIPTTDEVLIESICRRITSQLQRAVIGKRSKSSLPILVVIEPNKSKKALHVHLLIGRVRGEMKPLPKDVEVNHFVQGQLIKILKRITYNSNRKRTGRVGIADYKAVYSAVGLIDYLLKGLKTNSLNIAWSASNIDFSVLDVSQRQQAFQTS